VTTTQRLARFETAQEILVFLMASYSEKIYSEGKKPFPDTSKIAQWNAERKALFNLEDGLRLDDQAVIEQVISDYGPTLRIHFQMK